MSHTIKRLYYTNMFPRNCAYYGRRKGPPFPASPMCFSGLVVYSEEAYEKVLDILCGAVADYVEQNPDLRNQPTEDMWDFKDEEEDQDDSWDEEEDDWDEEEDYEDDEDY